MLTDPYRHISPLGHNELTLKQLLHIFVLQKCNLLFWYCSLQFLYFFMQPVQYTEYLVSAVDTDGLVL